MHVERDRNEIIERIHRLTPDKPAKWGKMNAPQMLAHLADAVRMGTGELPVRQKKMFLRYTPFKQLIIYALPFPKGAPTAPELISRAPAEWNGERAALLATMQKFSALTPDHAWPAHPIFGAMSYRDWGALAYKHFDHHLRQFGV